MIFDAMMTADNMPMAKGIRKKASMSWRALTKFLRWELFQIKRFLRIGVIVPGEMDFMAEMRRS